MVRGAAAGLEGGYGDQSCDLSHTTSPSSGSNEQKQAHPGGVWQVRLAEMHESPHGLLTPLVQHLQHERGGSVAAGGLAVLVDVGGRDVADGNGVIVGVEVGVRVGVASRRMYGK